MSNVEIANDAVEELLDWTYNKEGWETKFDKEGILGESRSVDWSDIDIFKGRDAQSFIGVDAVTVCDALWSFTTLEQWSSYDKEILGWEVKEEISPDLRIVWQLNKLSWPLWNRDMIMLQHRVSVDGKEIICYKSIEDDRWPVDAKNHVRCGINVSGYIFEDDVDGGCSGIRIAQVDPKGSIPSSVVNSFAGTLFKFGQTFRPVLDTYLSS